MKKNNIPTPAYYIAVAFVIVVVIVATVFQGCAVYGLSYVHGRPVEARGGYTSREAYLAGYEPYPVYLSGGYLPPTYWEINPEPPIMPALFAEGQAAALAHGRSAKVLFTVFNNCSGKTLALDLFYPNDNGILDPIAMKDGKAWNRIVLQPKEQAGYYISEGQLTYNVYRLGRGEDRAAPAATITKNVQELYRMSVSHYQYIIDVYDFN